MNVPGVARRRALVLDHIRSQNRNSAPVERVQDYDPQSGQVFTDTEIVLNRGQPSNWIGEYKTPRLVRKTVPNERGTRSLLEMAIIKIASELPNITAEHLVNVPWSLAEAVWEQVVSNHTDSLHVWRLFAHNYSSGHEFGQARYRYFLDLRSPSLSLQQYISGLRSPELKWLTAIRLSPKQVGISDLVEISKLQNLALLDLSDGQYLVDNKPSPFDQRVMRTWAELAEEGKAFQHLKWMLFGWQEHLAAWVFSYAPSFPALEKIVVTDCPQIHQRNKQDWEDIARENGWEARASKRSAKSLRPLLFGQNFHQGAISGCYFGDTTLHPPDEQAARAKNSSNRPMLECWIGIPKAWTHIADDFPGTRTVFFDRIRIVSPKSVRPKPVVRSNPGRNASMSAGDQASPQNNGYRVARSNPPRVRLSRQTVGIHDLLAQYSSNTTSR